MQRLAKFSSIISRRSVQFRATRVHFIHQTHILSTPWTRHVQQAHKAQATRWYSNEASNKAEEEQAQGDEDFRSEDEIPLMEYDHEEFAAIERAVESKLLDSLNATYVSVRDAGGCGIHLEVICESPLFIGIDKLKQHKMVVENLKDVMEAIDAHALTVHTRVPKPRP